MTFASYMAKSVIDVIICTVCYFSQVFIYLHKNASLLDTRISHEGCCMVSMDKAAERLYYRFDEAEVINNYWSDLRQVCLQQQLGSQE